MDRHSLVPMFEDQNSNGSRVVVVWEEERKEGEMKKGKEMKKNAKVT